jgi:hypothetical protein
VPERDVQPVGRGAEAPLLEKRRDVVRGGHVRETPRRGERRIAVAGRHVEDAFAGEDVDGLRERLPDDLEPHADLAEVARGPGRLLAGLDRLEVGRRRPGPGLGGVDREMHVVLLRPPCGAWSAGFPGCLSRLACSST